jgi:hypothetical protein
LNIETIHSDQNTQAIIRHIVWKHQAFKLHGTQKKASYEVWSITNLEHTKNIREVQKC